MTASRQIHVNSTTIAVELSGDGPPVLLLHGFPETRLMWRDIAPRLAERFTVLAADLPGYGDSGTRPSTPDHAPFSKRAMARDLVRAMEALGYDRFAVVGHDRGGRVAYRMALDHPATITQLAVLDVVPIDVVWDHADDRTMLGFWPFSFLAQDAPLPEQLLIRSAEAVVAHALSEQWGTPASTFDSPTRAAYVAALSDPDHARAICEEYRAASTLDRVHDAADRAADHRIGCPVLALWSGSGPLGSWYDECGGPLQIWRDLADDVRGEPVAGGHFFPEEHPAETADRLRRFLEEPARPR